MDLLSNMKVNIILPHNENCQEKKIGPVAQVVLNNHHYSKLGFEETIFGMSSREKVNFQNFFEIKKDIWSLFGKGFSFCKAIKKIIKDDHELYIIEIHNRPNYFNYFSFDNKKLKKVLYLHNDPRDMKGLRTKEERIRFINKIDMIIVISEYIKSCYLDEIKDLSYSKKISVVHNGIDRWIDNKPRKENLVIFSGRLNDDKGIYELIQALDITLPKFPKWKAIIFGRKDRNVNLKIYELMSKNRQIIFMGEKENSVVKKFLEKAAISCVPSKWEEPLSLSVIESLAAGCALLTSSKGGIPEIAGGKAHIINEVSKVNLIKSLEKLIKNQKYRKELQDKAWKNYSYSAKYSSQKLNKIRMEIIS